MTTEEKARTDGWKDEEHRKRFIKSVRELSENIKKLADKLQERSKNHDRNSSVSA